MHSVFSKTGPTPQKLLIFFSDLEFATMPTSLKRNGKVLEVRPQALRLLELLISGTGSVVSLDEIADFLWPNAPYGDRLCKVRVVMTHLRRAIGDNVSSPTCIETIRGQGYRFVAPVEYSEFSLVRRADNADTSRLFATR